MRNRKHTEKKTREAIRKQLQYLRRDLSIIDSMLQSGLLVPRKWQTRLETLRKIYEQQKYMYDNHTHSVPDRIVSVSQPFIRPIVRGKAGKPVEFRAKLDISVSDGWTRLERWSFEAYNEATRLIETIERFNQPVRDITRSEYWQTRFTATARISVIARHTGSSSAVRLWAGPRKMNSTTGSRHILIRMNG